MDSREFELDHPCGVTLSRRLMSADLEGIAGVDVTDMGTGYRWCELPTCCLDGLRVAMSLCFHDGAIDMLELALQDPRVYGAGWDEWSEAKEKRRARDTGKWLKAKGYSTGSFDWGEIWVGYDPKGGFGAAWVGFNRE